MKRNTEWDSRNSCYVLNNPKLEHPSVNELVQIIGILEDKLEHKEDKIKNGRKESS